MQLPVSGQNFSPLAIEGGGWFCCQLRQKASTGGSPLRLSSSGDDQHHAASKCHHADDRRQGNALFLVDRGVERSKVNDLLARRVRDALVGQGEHAENDESDTDESHEFHGALRPLLVMPFSGARSLWRRRFGGRQMGRLEISARFLARPPRTALSCCPSTIGPCSARNRTIVLTSVSLMPTN